jgi:SAM-dependent methyltransferase
MSWLAEPRLRGVQSGTRSFFEIQRRIIQERPLLRGIYAQWYAQLLADEASVPAGAGSAALVELGSGGSWLKELQPRVVTSDLVAGVADLVIDGRELPFADGSVRAIFLTHVFHHIPDAERFLAEAERVLVPGGVIAMIDVPHTPFARFFFRRFHPEPYDDAAASWGFDQSDAMRDANQALTWIVFFRDRARFERRFPGLSIEGPDYLPWLGYLASGGVTMRNFVPPLLVPAMRALDRVLAPLDRWMALHWHLVVRKRAAPIEGRSGSSRAGVW